MKRLGIFLVMVALIAGVVSCNGGVTYDLTMAVDPAGGGTATDLTGASPYAKDAAVNIKAVANPGYEFVNWSAPAGPFDAANDEETTFTMPARDVTVTANFVAVYDLTMAVNPVGGGTTTPTGTNSYAAGTDVSIKAVAAAGYEFVNWSAPAVTFGSATAADTTFTMPAQDVTVTANFQVEVGPLDHFKWYLADGAESIDDVVYLEDQFCAVEATVGYVVGFGNPAEKVHGEVTTPISNPDHHLTGYEITYEEEPQTWFVEVENQFGTQNLTVSGPFGLAVPTQKEGHQPPVGLDHYLVYEVVDGPSVDVSVSLQDEFDAGPQESGVYEPMYFANPVRKTHGSEVTEILDPEAHLVFYYIDASFSGEVEVVNQFGEQTLDVYSLFGLGGLAVPSEKITWYNKVVDHFAGYDVDEQTAPYIGEDVTLEDQFGAVEATVTYALGFGNPLEKWHDGEYTPVLNPDHHQVDYNISYEDEPGMWVVEVENQFGTQELTVWGPVMLAVPTQKEGHEPPVGLDHYLFYYVMSGTPMEEYIDLNDEFGYYEDVCVYEPFLFANPVRKTHGGEVTEIVNPNVCLVTYNAINPEPLQHEVQVVDQFGEHTIDVYGLNGLSVPSRILYYEPIP